MNITSNMDRFTEVPPPSYTRKVGMTETEAPEVQTMTLTEYKAMKAEQEKTAAQDALDEMKAAAADSSAPPFSIPRVDHAAAGAPEGKEEEAMFYATSNAIYGAGNGLSFCTKPFKRRGLDGTFTEWAAGDQVSLKASGEPIWGRACLDCAYTRSGCLPQPTAWGSIPMNQPTCTTKRGH